MGVVSELFHRVDWGDFPGMVTAGIAVFAVVQGIAPYRRQVADRRAVQARAVHAWVEGPVSGSQVGQFHLVNRSTDPVYDVVVELQRGSSSVELERHDVVPPASDRVRALGHEEQAHLLGEVRPEAENGLALATITFTDANGVRWVRRGRGELEELTAASRPRSLLGRILR